MSSGRQRTSRRSKERKRSYTYRTQAMQKRIVCALEANFSVVVPTSGDEQGSDAVIKREMERLTEDTHEPDLTNQELQIHMEPLRSIKAEEDPFLTDGDANAVYEFTPVAQTDEYLKTELILDEEMIDNMNDSETDCKQEVLSDHSLGAHTLTSQKRFECGFCSRSYTTNSSLKAHLSTHSKDRRREFACDLCGKTFYRNSDLNIHKKIHTGDRYPCKVCGKRFTQKQNLKIHMLFRQHFDKTQQFTPQSSNTDAAPSKTKVTSDEEFLNVGNTSEAVAHAEETQQPTLAGDNKQETRVDTAMESVTCEVCHNSYPGELIKAHMRIKHNNEAYKCQSCSRSFSSKSCLMRHLRTHSKDRRREFACDLCEKTFYYRGNLNIHKEIHTGVGYSCKVCGQRFTTKSNRKTHMLRRQHFDNPQQFTLQSSNDDVASMKTDVILDEEFIDEGNGKEPVTHTEGTQQLVLAGNNKQQTGVEATVDSVTYEVCHNSYPGEFIKPHMRIKHNNKCEFCSQSFSSKYCLTKHLRTHSKERRREFACDLCEKTFYYKGNLNIHKEIHTGDGYSCKVCGHSFTTKSNLKRHILHYQHFDNPQLCKPQSCNDDVASIKTELLLDEEFIDEGNGGDSVSHAERIQQPALAGNNKQQTGVGAAIDSVTREVCHNSYPGELIKANMRLSHNNTAYACQFCSRTYTTKSALKKHFRTHSKDGTQITPQSSNNDAATLKTEVISDEEFIDERDDIESAYNAEERQLTLTVANEQK